MIKVNQGHSVIDILTGKVDIASVTNGASLEIGEMNQGAEILQSEGNTSLFTINRINRV